VARSYLVFLFSSLPPNAWAACVVTAFAAVDVFSSLLLPIVYGSISPVFSKPCSLPHATPSFLRADLDLPYAPLIPLSFLPWPQVGGVPDFFGTSPSVFSTAVIFFFNFVFAFRLEVLIVTFFRLLRFQSLCFFTVFSVHNSSLPLFSSSLSIYLSSLCSPPPPIKDLLPYPVTGRPHYPPDYEASELPFFAPSKSLVVGFSPLFPPPTSCPYRNLSWFVFPSICFLSLGDGAIGPLFPPDRKYPTFVPWLY